MARVEVYSDTLSTESELASVIYAETGRCSGGYFHPGETSICEGLVGGHHPTLLISSEASNGVAPEFKLHLTDGTAQAWIRTFTLPVYGEPD